MSVVMQAPSGFTSGNVTGPSGTTYTLNSAMQVTASTNDVAFLLGLNFTAIGGPAAFVCNPRNILDAGDFTTNPWQRNISGLWSSSGISGVITNTPIYFPDRWFVVAGASSSVQMAKISDGSIQNFNQSLKISRTVGNTDVSTINFGQAVKTATSISVQGQQVSFSFWAKQGANYSGGALSVAVITGTGNNQTAAQMVNVAWTGQASSVTGSQSLTTSMTRYTFTGNLPATATQVGVLLSWKPTGTAGADDSITINGLQLEIGASASAFEHMDLAHVLLMCQTYAYCIPEPPSGVLMAIGGATQGANAQQFYKLLPTTMFVAPTVTVGTGSFKVCAGAAAATATGLAAGATHTQNEISLVSTLTQAAGGAASLQGGGGTGYILASSDF